MDKASLAGMKHMHGVATGFSFCGHIQHACHQMKLKAAQLQNVQ